MKCLFAFLQDISRRILNEEPIMPSYATAEAIDLMTKLLVKDPTRRLGKSMNFTTKTAGLLNSWTVLGDLLEWKFATESPHVRAFMQ